ncbi:MAG: hypothetical protein ACPL7M_16010 [Bryobacteraceae bacterium]
MLPGLMADGVEAVERLDTSNTRPLAEHGVEIHSDLVDRLLHRPGGGPVGWLERGRLLARGLKSLAS